jgi:uncharacterized protein (DUF2141 family)
MDAVQWIFFTGLAGQIEEEDSMRIVRAAFVLVSVLFISTPLLAGDAPLTGNLNMVFTGFKSDKGMARIEVMDSEQAYTNEAKAMCLIKSRIKDKKVEITLKGLPYGKYAIAVFHDLNGNGVLDKNLMGIPKEAYGSSNNIRGKFGPPDYSKIGFDLNVPEVTQQITVW